MMLSGAILLTVGRRKGRVRDSALDAFSVQLVYSFVVLLVFVSVSLKAESLSVLLFGIHIAVTLYLFVVSIIGAIQYGRGQSYRYPIRPRWRR